ncbi:MAG: hypothetical protein Q9212_002589, partial [Teloschistes hypoglaucus]
GNDVGEYRVVWTDRDGCPKSEGSRGEKEREKARKRVRIREMEKSGRTRRWDVGPY